MTKPLEALIADVKAAAELSITLSNGGYKKSHRAAYAKSEFRKLVTEENIQSLIAALEQAQKESKVQLETIANLTDIWNDGRLRIAELEAKEHPVRPVMFIDGDISPSDADKLVKVIQGFNDEEERPLAKMARIIRENPNPTNECDKAIRATGGTVGGE